MEQEILTPPQKTVIGAVASEPKLANFYLSGGTALAGYYLFHRLSDDLDFFIVADPDSIFLHGFAKELKETLGAANVRFEKRYDRNQFFFAVDSQELKVEFTTYPFQQLEKPLFRDGINIDSLRDIAANKLMALLDRFDPKDFADLFFILQERKLEDIWKDAEKKFAIKISHLFLGGEFAKVRRIEALPKMIKSLRINELKAYFEKLVRSLEQNIF